MCCTVTQFITMRAACARRESNLPAPRSSAALALARAPLWLRCERQRRDTWNGDGSPITLDALGSSLVASNAGATCDAERARARQARARPSVIEVSRSCSWKARFFQRVRFVLGPDPCVRSGKYFPKRRDEAFAVVAWRARV
jgi:hypothetical protein